MVSINVCSDVGCKEARLAILLHGLLSSIFLSWNTHTGAKGVAYPC